MYFRFRRFVDFKHYAYTHKINIITKIKNAISKIQICDFLVNLLRIFKLLLENIASFSVRAQWIQSAEPNVQIKQEIVPRIIHKSLVPVIYFSD